MHVNGVSMALQINQLWEFGELVIFLFKVTGDKGQAPEFVAMRVISWEE